jgi:uncharacterized protein (DUF697 family)
MMAMAMVPWRRRTAARPAPPVVVPGNEAALEEIAERCRRLVRRRALMSAGAVLVPVPGLDFAADVALLARLIDEINAEFGLTPAQIERIDSRERLLLYRTLASFGTALVGRVVTPGLVVRALASVGTRITAKTATRYVPIVGQGVAAGISFAAMRHVGLKHIRDCERVWKELMVERDTGRKG